uniref:Rx N-terminal domain-containing protein n=1 Tax=Populus alba TaxID=43335 RepID=A0A4U5QWQ5_POPAL|nr:hypothetical protein D5086_0000032290 [Populus alba]
MAEAFAAEIAKSLLGKLGSFAVQEFRLAWGLEDDLARLEERLKAINAVLSDAEKQQSKKERIRLWLHMLREVLYDAEDVLDEIECETLQRQVVKTKGSTSRKVRRFFSSSNMIPFSLKMGHKIKKIIERLAEISSLKSDFNLSEQAIDCSHVLHEETGMNRSFDSFSGLIGRDEDKERIISLLEAPFKVVGAHPLVLPIVGMGGLGKTSLAKSVCDAENVKSHFDLNMENNFFKDLQNPFKHLSSKDCPNIKEMPNCINLKKLQNLKISDCSSLSKWCRRGTGEDWLKIKNIRKIMVDDDDSGEETSD